MAPAAFSLTVTPCHWPRRSATSLFVDADVIIAGGGLSAGLTAYRLLRGAPGRRIVIIEVSPRLGGNHTWSAHAADIAAPWLDPFIVKRWPGQRVRFPRRVRSLDDPYFSITSDRLHDVVTRAPGIDVRLGTSAVTVSADAVQLSDGTTLRAPLILDARGPMGGTTMAIGFQKFVGLELRLTAPHGLETPLIMDATVPQTDGYRFVYVLPFSADTVLIEDTYYADAATMDAAALDASIADYATAQGWQIAQVVRREAGVLPIVLDGDIDAFWRGLAGGPAPIGLRAGLFHPVTGYSLPDAVRLADLLTTAGPADTATAFQIIEQNARAQWHRHAFYRLLNRMLFEAARPQQRYIVLERFYGLPAPIIRRFYAGQSTFADRARILAGKPPVPLMAALRAMPPRRVGRSLAEGVLG